MNIYQKLIEVRKLVDFLQKDTQGYQYKYVSGSSVLNAIRPKMDEIGLILTTDIVEVKQDRYQWDGLDNKGNPKTITQFVVSFKMKMNWIDADEPDVRLISDWFSSGEDEDPAKANGKAHTYGERYYLLKFFNIATDNEDPDAHQKKLEKKENIEPFKTKSLKEQVIESGIKKCGDMDKFNVWRVNHNLPEDLDKASQIQLSQIWAVLKSTVK